MRPFLTAKWVNVALLSYRGPAEMLRPWLPPGCELDLRDGEAFVSLVAFDFTETRVRGIGWPGFRSFPEINLRFYVRHGNDRGVCFIREYVPSRVVAGLAKRIYNEPYVTAPMESATRQDDGQITVQHRLMVRGKANTIEITGTKPSWRPPAESVEHFFKEHQWGFGRTRSGKLLRYEVIHPQWDVFPVQAFKLDWDWAGVYGAEWSILQDAQPYSVILAAGSEVAVYPRENALNRGAIIGAAPRRGRYRCHRWRALGWQGRQEYHDAAFRR